MKKIYLFLMAGLLVPFLTYAAGGCSVVVQTQNVMCNGNCDGMATASHTGPGPYTYLWMPMMQTTGPVAAALCPGTYTVTVTDANGCNATATFAIYEPQPISVPLAVTGESCNGCCDGSISSAVTGGTPPYTFNWSTQPTQTTSTANGLCSGSYTLCVTDANGCLSCAADTVSFSTGITANEFANDLSVYPVPATETVNVRQAFSSPVSAEVTVTNMLGEIVFTRAERPSVILDINLNVSALQPGVYFVTVKTVSGTSVKRIIRE